MTMKKYVKMPHAIEAEPMSRGAYLFVDRIRN